MSVRAPETRSPESGESELEFNAPAQSQTVTVVRGWSEAVGRVQNTQSMPILTPPGTSISGH